MLRALIGRPAKGLRCGLVKWQEAWSTEAFSRVVAPSTRPITLLGGTV